MVSILPASILGTIVSLIDLLFQIFYYLLLARVIFSFLALGAGANPTLLAVRRLVYRFTEPVLAPVRSLVKPVNTGAGAYLDLSPLIVFLILPYVKTLVLRLVFFIF
jgi:YggT family protein